MANQEDDEEELKFNIEDVQKIVRDNIELCLGGNIYSHSRTPQWIAIITDKTLSRLNKLNKPFKYILRITITQKNGAALHSAAAYYWDVTTDGTCTVRWENNGLQVERGVEFIGPVKVGSVFQQLMRLGGQKSLI